MSPKGYTNLKFLTSPLCNSEVFICTNTIYLLLFLVSKAAIISKNNSNTNISEVDAMLFFNFKNKSGFEKNIRLKWQFDLWYIVDIDCELINGKIQIQIPTYERKKRYFLDSR